MSRGQSYLYQPNCLNFVDKRPTGSLLLLYLRCNWQWTAKHQAKAVWMAESKINALIPLFWIESSWISFWRTHLDFAVTLCFESETPCFSPLSFPEASDGLSCISVSKACPTVARCSRPDIRVSSISGCLSFKEHRNERISSWKKKYKLEGNGSIDLRAMVLILCFEFHLT